MTIRFRCPKCGKKYALRDELHGEKGKCLCGAVIRIPSPKLSASELLESNTSKKNGATICTKCLKTIKNGEARKIIDGQTYCVNCASRPYSIAMANERRSKSTWKNNQTSYLSGDRPLTEEWVRKSFLSRLIGFSVGILIVTILLYLYLGIVYAILSFILGLVFTFIAGRACLNYDRKLVKNKVTYEQLKAKVRLSNKTQTKIAVAVLVIALCLFVLIKWYRTGDKVGYKNLIDSFLPTNITFGIALLAINIPVFILIGRLMVGSWESYWRVTKFFLKCLTIPFFHFTKGYWESFETFTIEECILVGATDFLCVALYLVECSLIKVIFLS